MVMLHEGPHDNYREQILANPATYPFPESDSFDQNAVSPQNPMHPARTRTAAYPNQQLTKEWIIQLRQFHKEV